MSEIIYLAGPMSGIPEYNWPAFKRVTEELRNAGYQTRCPTESGATHETPYHECLKADLKLLLECNAITFLPGWWKSRGATFEALIAKVLGYRFYKLDPDMIVLETNGPSTTNLINYFLATLVDKV